MSGKNMIFRSKEIKNRKEAAEVLRQFADKVEVGTINLIQNNEEVSLNLSDSIEVKIEAKSKEKKLSTKKRIEIEIEWKEGEISDASVEIK